jgi:hypothetical protein
MREKHRSMIHLPLIGGTPTRTINGVTVQAQVCACIEIACPA